MHDVASQAERIEASHDDFASFKASTKTTPSDREALRKLIEEVTAGITPQVVSGFERIEPLPARKCLSIATPTLVRRSTRIVTDSIIELVGDTELLSLMVGVSTDAIRRWPSMVPARHENRCQLIMLNWPIAEKTIKYLKKSEPISMAANRCDMRVDDLRYLLDTLNLTHIYKSATDGE